MNENEIEEMLDHLRRIKIEGNLDFFKIRCIERLDIVLRVFRTFIKYHVLLPDCFVELTMKAEWTVEMLRQVTPV
ncbi:hypothetical protein KY290_037943 [Solanum tuberosum]|uniref:Uncharacterized protein n=1 Tax=Solanum tuberosum TaxID=4113 RepID=A0ABQ7TYF5_SOLTU|nr:hypothetical protein KY284_037311 [Solanum tuberosum]KAH0637603.1 hypothetical protein KY289_037518 [Solanum tuberosum]KAH0640714.1 hypothetical protein KY285_037300 [Solanum tuberosum]KAH0739238.1 hypothetical protein KY290_037943 [Solanum tuberosum]